MVFPDGVSYSEILFKNVVAKAAKQGILVDDLPDQKEAEWIDKVQSKDGLVVNSEMKLTNGRLITIHHINMPVEIMSQNLRI